MVRQVALVPAGCQPWNPDVVAAHTDRFAYSATLAIYIYEIDDRGNEYNLISIMSEHKKTITSICWCPDKPDYLASSSVDGCIIVWDIKNQKTISRYDHKESVFCMGWAFTGRMCLGFMNKTGPIWQWYVGESKTMSFLKETQSFSSNVVMFRWHHEKHSCLAFGHEDGSVSVLEIGSKAIKHIFKPEISEEEVAADPIIALEWDPLSNDYLLLCNLVHGVRLVDVPNQQQIMLFHLPSTASQVQTFSWIKNAPGMFVTGDFKGGILRVWSVSNQTPIENIKIKGTGFHRLEVLHIAKKKDANVNISNNHQHVSSNSEAQAPAMTNTSRFTLPHAEIVCTFKDGGVGLYDLGHKRWKFLRDQGHIETIFDCKFKPDNANQLATASFDGTVKIWDVTTMTCLSSSPGNEGIIYQISWAPADLDCIAACTAKNGTFLYDVKKGKIIKKLMNHVPKTTVFSVAWNHVDSKLIMTCGADGYCIIQQVSGNVIQKYKHPGAVYGCDWSPFNKDMLATGCEDKSLRVFFMAASASQSIKVFTGHKAKVFHVRWNPLKEGILCSGSDDGNIRVWDYTHDQCICVLSGHTGPVRGLTWNSEVATILASGSWDYTIRIWDTRDGTCLYSILDHGADVYGLTSHPSRPFLLASCSRDSTVRLWLTTSLVQPIELQILAGKPYQAMSDSTLTSINALTYALCGRASKELYSNYAGQTHKNAFLVEEFSKFFSHPCGTTNLWDLVSVILDRDTLVLSPSYPCGIVHRNHITKFKGSEAQQLEMIKMSKFGGGIGAPSKEERLKEAARIHIKLGNIQRYCELMVELGKWERALAIAPAVSMKYWKKLNDRYCAFLISEENPDAVPFSVAGGDIHQLVSFLTAHGQVSDAVIIAQSASEGSIKVPDVNLKPTRPHEADDLDEFDRLAVEVMENLADTYFYKGCPVLAACCHLAVDNPKKAISALIRGHELELALSIGQVLGNVCKETDIAIELLSRRCEGVGRWELGLDLLKLQENSSLQQAKLCARCSASMTEINSLHQKAELPSMELCESKARALSTSTKDILECVKFYLLSPISEEGLILGLKFVHDKMQHTDWTADDVFPMLQLLGCMKSEKLQLVKYADKMHELLALSAYVGALVAIKRQYFPVVRALFLHAKDLILKRGLTLTVSGKQIDQDLNLFSSVVGNSSDDPSYKQLLHRCGTDPDWTLEPGPDYVASSNLPSYSDIHISILSREKIRGQAFFLEDGQSAISLNEALMWAKVNPFSPLGSGVRLNPF
ncbi:WD repeat-containing protein 17-like [Physella acuta]|uniref:WD repeat-containing protein 17-like n=1 Tax=Physella acuta TaxID=109671 RepID=UPI0027DBFDEE|nr:WD repeat-containing protein 17-like [Physella acuta]XP_059144022.1 WD repeat-containing protein 17-like [Physella acuta]